jgi:hypothetical protein
VHFRVHAHLDDAQAFRSSARATGCDRRGRSASHRRADPAGQNVEGDEFADRQVAVDHQLGAEIEDARRDQLIDELQVLSCLTDGCQPVSFPQVRASPQCALPLLRNVTFF